MRQSFTTVLAAVSGLATTTQAHDITTQVIEDDGHAAEDSYNYAVNGADWTDTMCVSGTRQSPIDFNDSEPMLTAANWMTIEREGYQDYTTQEASLTMLTHVLQMSVPHGQSEITYGDMSEEKINAVQLHFHSPSEHTVNGQHYDMEMHIVHLFEDGSLGAVLGVFFDRSVDASENSVEFLEELDFSMATEDGNPLENASLNSFLDQIDMEKFWNYDGSLTTPPCTEGVNWIVFEEAQPLSEEVYQDYMNKWSTDQQTAGSNRAVQPMNGRTIWYSDDMLARSVTLIAGTAMAFLLAF